PVTVRGSGQNRHRLSPGIQGIAAEARDVGTRAVGTMVVRGGTGCDAIPGAFRGLTYAVAGFPRAYRHSMGHLNGMRLPAAPALAQRLDIDWSASPLGAPAEWPAVLTTTVELCLNACTGMLVIWGTQ